MQGKCLCEKVRFHVQFRLNAIYYCHCSQCRRASGSSFATNVAVARRNLTITAGQDLIRSYSSSPGKHRRFCSNCGSPLYSEYSDEPDTIYLRVGTVDDNGQLRACAHIHTESRASWYAIRDDLPQHPHDTDVREFPL
jgi:hypothetical protein